MALIFMLASGALLQVAAQRIIGYMPSWAGDANSIQYSKLSHINYAFALPTSDGSIKAIDNPSKLQTIVSRAHAQGTKVLIAVGGWSDNGVPLDPTFEALASNATSRARFVTACMSLVNQYGLDGVDIDWEYPDAGQSSNNFDQLMTALSAQLKPQGKLLTAAVIGNGGQGAGVSATVFSLVDWLNIMAYDASDFQHSTYDYALQCLSYWSGRGLAKSKISLGVPFYGRPTWESYASLVNRGADPNQDVFGNVGYNGIPTIKKKTQYVKDNAYGGIMIWELSQDLGNTNSLLSAIYSVVGTVTPPPVPQSPYAGTAAAIPGKIEAERYDLGGQNIAYYDNTSGNSGSSFRSDDVDVEACTDAGAGYNVGYVAAGEWLEYTVNVTAGTYKLEARVASTAAGKSFHVEMNGTNVSGSISVPNTGGWQTWQTVTINNISLTAGQKVMRIYFDTDELNLNYLNFTTSSTPPPTNVAPTVSLTSPANNATANAPATISIAANASDADGSVTKVEFFVNGSSTPLATDNTAPYTYTWSNVAAGTYTITAKATDDKGASTTSSAVTIKVNSVTGNCTTPAWDANAVYVGGNRASRNGTIYEAKWWSQGEDPLQRSGQWDVWKVIGACNAKISMTASNDVSAVNYISVGPNPSFGTLYVELNTTDVNSIGVQLFDSFGMEVFSATGIQSGEALNIQSLSSGIYVMKITAGEQVLTQRVVKQ